MRVHSECLTGDVFHSLRCDCGEQLESALAMIEREGRGVLLYLAQEGRGIGLLNKLRAYKLQEEGLDTVDANLELGLPADLRDYGIGAQILVDLGLSARSASSPTTRRRSAASRATGCRVTEQVPIEHAPNPHNEAYLRAKARADGPHAAPPGARTSTRRCCTPSASTTRERGERPTASGRARERSRSSSARFYEDLAERLVAGAPGGVRRGRGAARSTSSTCPARSSCRWPRSYAAPSRAATPASPASAR